MPRPDDCPIESHRRDPTEEDEHEFFAKHAEEYGSWKAVAEALRNGELEVE